MQLQGALEITFDLNVILGKFLAQDQDHSQSYPYQPKKFWGGNEVLPEFCDVCPNHDFRVHFGYDKKIVWVSQTKTNFVLKSWWSLKKKRSSPKFGLLFLAVPHHHLSKFPDFAQIFHIAARKTMVLPKYFLLTARKILILPKSSKLGGAIAPPASPAGTAMLTVVVFSARKPHTHDKFLLTSMVMKNSISKMAS